MSSGLTIGWEYLTGYSVATDPSARGKAEWPPHPARVFMALAAAWFESSPEPTATLDDQADHSAEADALRWLEGLGEPQLITPHMESESVRTSVTVYVPVNDKIDPGSTSLQSASAFTRNRQAREFPRRFVGDQPCYLHWPIALNVSARIDALDRLCMKVTRIGHSSSLVRMWTSTEPPSTQEPAYDRWRPSEVNSKAHIRVVTAGLFDALPNLTQIANIEAFAQAVWQVEDAEAESFRAKVSNDAKLKKATNAELKLAKGRFEEQTGKQWKKGISPPPRLRPTVGMWSGYDLNSSAESVVRLDHSNFDTDLLILARTDGPQLPIGSTLQISRALRGAILANCKIDPIPEWISGHLANGEPSSNPSGHAALLPLPFVGHQHADGRLMGVAIAFPRQVDRRERGSVFGPLLLDPVTLEPRPMNLRLGRLGVWEICKADWSDNRQALTPETWTAMPQGARCWASVTPVVLDRFPKSKRSDPNQRESWQTEVQDIIADSCSRLGLPKPTQIDLGSTCWHLGSPRAYGKHRRLRGTQADGVSDTSLGEYFSSYPAKNNNASRPQVHVRIEFAKPVLGPIILGAGRFMGYGLLKPWRPSR